MGWALQSYFGAVTVAIFIVLAVSPWGTLGTLALNSPSHAGTALGTAWGGPGLACRDESTLGVFAVTLSPEHTLVTVQHVARLAHAALLAGGGNFRTDIFAEALWVQAGRQAGGKAAGVLGVGRALESDFGASTAAFTVVLAVGLWGTLEILALDIAFHAGTALGTAFGGPGLACRNDGTPGIFTAALCSGHTFVLTEHKAMVAKTSLPAAGGDAWAGDLTAVGTRRHTGGKAVCELAVGWAL